MVTMTYQGSRQQLLRLSPEGRAARQIENARNNPRRAGRIIHCNFFGCKGVATGGKSQCNGGDHGVGHHSLKQKYGVTAARQEWMLNLAQGLDYAIAQARAKRLGHQCTPEGFVYLILFDQWVKLGRTCDVDRRMLAYERAEGVRPVILATAQVDDQFASERTLLDLARQAGLTPTRGNEWFPLEATPILAASMPRG